MPLSWLHASDKLVSVAKTSRPCSPREQHVALVSHLSKDYFQQACMIVLELRRNVVAVAPIFADTKVELAQDAGRGGFVLRVDDTEVTVYDVAACAPLLSELKRMEAIAVQRGWTTETEPYDWVKHYAVTDQARRDKDALSRTFWSRPGKAASDGFDLQEAKFDWAVKQLHDREDNFTKMETVSCFVSTFNVNNQMPNDDVTKWLESLPLAQQELIVLGFQELDTGTQSLFVYTPQRQAAWLAAIERALEHCRPSYAKIQTCQLVGLLIVVLARTDVVPAISDVSVASVATGLLGLVANKGAVGIRLRFKDTVFCFVNCHLAAFANMTAKRNADLEQIAANLVFDTRSADSTRPDLMPSAERRFDCPPTRRSIWDAHHLVLLGDLNYRLQVSRDDAEHLLDRKAWRTLLATDQLTAERHKYKHVLAAFDEAQIDFAPTFKYDLGTSTYDSSEKQRTPSYTDRILWLSLRHDRSRAKAYQCHQDVLLSDHKPVSLLLQANVQVHSSDAFEKVVAEVLSEVSAQTTDGSTELAFESCASIEFDEAKLGKRTVVKVRLKNTSDKVSAMWQCDCATMHGPTTLVQPRVPTYLRVEPSEGYLIPGQAVELRVELHIDEATARRLNFVREPESQLSDVLLFTSGEERSTHHYLTLDVRQYVRTVVGNSLERLAGLDKPIRNMTADDLDRIVAGSSKPRDIVPEPIDRLMQFLSKHAISVPDLFAASADTDLIDRVLDALDTGDDLPVALSPPPNDDDGPAATVDIGRLSVEDHPVARASISLEDLKSSSEATMTNDNAAGMHAVAHALLRMLDSLEEPVVPRSFYARACDADVDTLEKAYVLAGQLPPVHSNVMIYIAAFLRAYVNESSEPDKSADRIAHTFSQVLLKPSGGASISPKRAHRFVFTLIHAEL